MIDALLDESIVRSRIEVWDVDTDRTLLRLPLNELADETPFPQLLICPQSITERLLYEAVEEQPSAEVRFSSEVLGFEQRDDFVEVYYEWGSTEETVTASFVAGCDGAHSTVRSVLETSFEGRTYRTKAALADVRIGRDDAGLSFPRITRRQIVATAVRIDAERWRIIMPRAPDSEERPPLATHVEQAVIDLFPGVPDYTTTWKSEFNLHRRISSRFVQGRTVLAGDAAHLTSPVGGQGMNIGIQDAYALATALRAVGNREAPASLLDYEDERRSVLDGGVVRVTDVLTQSLLAGQGTILVPALWSLDLLLRIGPLRRAVMRRLALLKDPSRSGLG